MLLRASPPRHCAGGLALNRRFVRAASEKLFVPPDAFGGRTPERVASEQMACLITHAAVLIVADQMPNGGDTSGERRIMMNLLRSSPIKDADEWLRELSLRAPFLAARVAATRLAYASEEVLGFEWHNVRRLTVQQLASGNTTVSCVASTGKESGARIALSADALSRSVWLAAERGRGRRRGAATSNHGMKLLSYEAHFVHAARGVEPAGGPCVLRGGGGTTFGA